MTTPVCTVPRKVLAAAADLMKCAEVRSEDYGGVSYVCVTHHERMVGRNEDRHCPVAEQAARLIGDLVLEDLYWHFNGLQPLLTITVPAAMEAIEARQRLYATH